MMRFNDFKECDDFKDGFNHPNGYQFFMMRDNAGEPRWKDEKLCRDPCGAHGEVLPKDAGRRSFWKV